MKFLITLLALTSLVSAQTTYRFTTVTGGVSSFNTTTLNADVIVNGTTNKVFTSTEKTKLAGIDLSGYALSVDVATLLADKSDITHTHTFASLTSKPTTVSGYGITDAPTGSGTSTGANTGDNAVNSNYVNDYRSANFIAGTNYLAPNGSAASLTNFPTLNQNTSGNAATATALTSGDKTIYGMISVLNGSSSFLAGLVTGNYAGFSCNGSLSSNSYAMCSSPSDPTLYFNRPTGSDIAFQEAQVTQVTLRRSGNFLIGVGTDDATSKLQVFGAAKVTGTTTATGGLILPTETTPASATATGTKGTICWDSSYIYVCTATNTWKRTAITTWP